MLKVVLITISLIAVSHNQNVGDDAKCNPQPIVNYHFGPSESYPSFAVNGNRLQNATQGRPGRVGPPGSPGALGPKGQKGEKGQTDDTLSTLMQMQTQIEQLRRKSDEQEEQIQELNSKLQDNVTRALHLGYMELEDGWITPFNGYQYKPTSSMSTWDESRRICQSWGGDLLAYGFRDFATRTTIHRALALPDGNYWLGLSDQANENDFRWVNGHRAASDDRTLWWPGEPNNARNEDCAIAVFSIINIYGFSVWDDACRRNYRAICEKLV